MITRRLGSFGCGGPNGRAGEPAAAAILRALRHRPSGRALASWVVLPLALATAGCAAADAGAAVPVPSKWRGTITGTVYGQPFKLSVRVELSRRLAGERNPFHLFVGTAANPSTAVGAVTYFSAARYLTPLTARRITLRYVQIGVSGQTISAPLVDVHRQEAAALVGFTAPNVCLSVYSPFECVLPGPELFAFKPGARLTLRITGRAMAGTLAGTGSGYAQILPYPTVAYRASLSARRA